MTDRLKRKYNFEDDLVNILGRKIIHYAEPPCLQKYDFSIEGPWTFFRVELHFHINIHKRFNQVSYMNLNGMYTLYNGGPDSQMEEPIFTISCDSKVVNETSPIESNKGFSHIMLDICWDTVHYSGILTVNEKCEVQSRQIKTTEGFDDWDVEIENVTDEYNVV